MGDVQLVMFPIHTCYDRIDRLRYVLIVQSSPGTMTAELRKLTHKDRLNIGQQISKRVLNKYGDAVLTVFICGSTAKQLDRPYSDLEMIVAVRDGVEIPMKYYLYNGLVVEIDYRQESNFLRAARRVTQNWPNEADQYRNRLVIFDREGWMRRLDEAVRESDGADFTEAIRWASISVTESMGVLRNAHLTGDMIGVRARGA